MNTQRAIFIFIFLVLLPQSSTTAAETEIVKPPESLATGPGSTLATLLEKTFLNIDILRLEIVVDRPTQERLVGLVKGKKYEPDVAKTVTETVLNLSNGRARIHFLRDVALHRFLDGALASVSSAHEAGYIDDLRYRAVAEGMPRWFGFLDDRGFEEGDEIRYEISAQGLRTMMVTKRGRVLLDQTDPGKGPPRALMAGYLAPDSDFREGLISSLIHSVNGPQ